MLKMKVVYYTYEVVWAVVSLHFVYNVSYTVINTV
jgi:hypothetical protein